jgi:hypothetical protein
MWLPKSKYAFWVLFKGVIGLREAWMLLVWKELTSDNYYNLSPLSGIGIPPFGFDFFFRFGPNSV